MDKIQTPEDKPTPETKSTATLEKRIDNAIRQFGVVAVSKAVEGNKKRQIEALEAEVKILKGE